MNHSRLPTRLVAYRRVGQDSQDPSGGDSTSTDPGSSDITGGSDPNSGDPGTSGSSSGSGNAVTDVTNWLASIFTSNASSSNNSSSSSAPTNNAAVPGVTTSTGPSPTVIALGVGAALAAGLGIYAIAKRR